MASEAVTTSVLLAVAAARRVIRPVGSGSAFAGHDRKFTLDTPGFGSPAPIAAADHDAFPVAASNASTCWPVPTMTLPPATTGDSPPIDVAGSEMGALHTTAPVACDRATSTPPFSTRYTFPPAAAIALCGVVCTDHFAAPVAPSKA